MCISRSGQGESPRSWRAPRTARRGNAVWFPAIGRLFADNGMAFVAQDTRGHHESGGGLAPFDEARRRLGHARVDHAAAVVERIDSRSSASRMSGSRPSRPQAAATRRCAPPPCATRARTSRATGCATRACSVSSSSFAGRWRHGPGPRTSPPSSTSRIRPLDQIARGLAPQLGPDASQPCSTTGRGAADLEALVRASRLGPRSLIGCASPCTSRPDGGTCSSAAPCVTGPGSPLDAGVESRLVADLTDHAGRDWSDGPTPDPLADFDDLADRMPAVLASELAFLRTHLLDTSDGESATRPGCSRTWGCRNRRRGHPRASRR